MKLTSKMLLVAACFALAVSLMFAGSASAKYQSDGVVPDMVGGWVTPSDGVCVLGLDMTGAMSVDGTITTVRDCQARLINVTAALVTDCTAAGVPYSCCTGLGTGTCAVNNDTLANVCGNSAKNTAGVKYAAPGSSTCVTIDGSGYITGSLSLADLDRNAVMCNELGGQLANATPTTLSNGGVITIATKTTANGAAAKCIAYGFQFAGQDANGTPLAFGAEGTVQAAGTGFCYTNVMKTGIPAGSCPSLSTDSSVAFGYSVVGGNCVYEYGIAGDRTSALTKADGTTNGPNGLNMASYTTLGDCLANGGSWNNWIPAGTAVTAPGGTATIMTFDLTRQAVASTEGCLHCHSLNGAQYNGPAERWKDSYLKTGHKNMLRKVTNGVQWAGPDGVVYTAAASGQTLNWGDGTATGSYGTLPLLYIFGEWMAPAPDGLDTVIQKAGPVAKYNGGSSDYSCAACHTAGWSNTDPTKGLCSLSSKTTESACTTAGGTWYPYSGVQRIGTPAYAAKQPGDSWPGVAFGAAGQWDQDGIVCSRCHDAAVPNVTATQIAASLFPQTRPLQAHHGAENGPTAEWATKICYSCHQSMAKTSNGTGTDNDLAHPENIPVKLASPATALKYEFSGHVLGGSFLNSPHARATGTVAPNSLGKYDLVSPLTYGSAFKGFNCWQSPTSTSAGMTKEDGSHITTKAECEAYYGAGSWRADARGNCTTCHDVHNSLFVEGQHGLRKECESCHEDATYAAAVPQAAQVDVATINHLGGDFTPFDSNLYVNACEVCHMPKASPGGFPMHLWRINTDPAYRTFPTDAEWTGNTLKIGRAATETDGAVTYTPAVWVDCDLACGQCHGGGASEASPAFAIGEGHRTADIPYRSKAALCAVAEGIHDASGTVCSVTFSTSVTPNTLDVNVDATVSGTGCTGLTYDWNWGDGEPNGSGDPAVHTYATAGSKTITLTASNADGEVGTSTRSVTLTAVNLAPTASATCAFNANTWTYDVTDTSTDDGPDDNADIDADPTLTISVDWGDGSTKSYGSDGGAFSHVYNKAGTFPVTVKAVDNILKTSTYTCVPNATPAVFSISGTVIKSVAKGGGPLYATVQLLNSSNVVIKSVSSSAVTGAFSFGNLKPGTYKIKAKKTGYTFPAATTIVVGPSSSGNTIQALTP